MALKLSTTWFELIPQLRFEPTARRIRAQLGSGPVLDTADALLVWEPARVTPVFAVPAGDLDAELVPSAASAGDPHPAPVMDPRFPFSVHTAEGTAFDVVASDQTLPAAAFRPNDPDLGGRVLLDFNAFEKWFEEDQEIRGQPEGQDLAWSYETVLPDSAQLQDSVCFYDERTDVYVDGQKREITALYRF